MIENKNIVCVSYTTWHGDFTKSIVQLLTYLAQKNNVLFSEYPFTIKDTLLAAAGKKPYPFKKMIGLSPRITQVETNKNSSVLLHNAPPVFPWAAVANDNLFYSLLKYNSKILSGSINSVIKKRGLHKPIVINSFNPFFGINQVGAFNESLNIYYCIDAINDYRNKDRGLEVENRYCQIVDGVITTSEELYNSKIKINPNTIVVKNGVDFDLFAKAANPKTLDNHNPKRIGFIGSIDYRFDIELMIWLINEMPEYEFIFLGRNDNQKAVEALQKLKNAILMPPVKADEVPQIMNSCSVGLIPFTLIEQNRNVYPLKINEYLSIGLPVVLTDFANFKEFGQLISIAKNKEDFKEKILMELKTNTLEKKQKRIEFAKLNSWANRAQEFSDAIEKIAASVKKTI